MTLCQGAENAKLWCPVCKQGELRETHNLIHCTLCKIRLDLEEDKVIPICTFAGFPGILSSFAWNHLIELDNFNLFNQVNLDFLRERLANVHMEHLDRGCTLSPKFCLHDMFGLNALYIRCDECSTFEVVV